VRLISRTRDELARIAPERACCRRAELAGLIGSLLRGGWPADERLELTTESAGAARRLIHLSKQVLGGAGPVAARRRERLRRTTVYAVALPTSAVRGFWEAVDRDHPPDRACCQQAFTRGAFLGAGFVADPERGYHWEVVTARPEAATRLARALSAMGLAAGTGRRRGRLLVYLKTGEDIASWLGQVGAHHALLAFENVRALREVRGRVNRRVNAETANLQKTVTASLRQLADIEALRDGPGLEALPPSLRELARLRLEHREASLAELGRLLEPPLSKSTVNHRFRRLARLARRLERQEGGRRSPSARGSPSGTTGPNPLPDRR